MSLERCRAWLWTSASASTTSSLKESEQSSRGSFNERQPDRQVGYWHGRGEGDVECGVEQRIRDQRLRRAAIEVGQNARGD